MTNNYNRHRELLDEEIKVAGGIKNFYRSHISDKPLIHLNFKTLKNHPKKLNEKRPPQA